MRKGSSGDVLLEVRMSLVELSVFGGRNSVNRDVSQWWNIIEDGVIVGSLSRSFLFY